MIQEYDANHDYGIDIATRICKVLSVIKKGEKFSRPQLTKLIKSKYQKQLNKSKPISDTYATYLSKNAISVGQKINVLELDDRHSMSVREFIKLPTVANFISGLKECKLKNLKQLTFLGESTKGGYTYRLRDFNSWITGRTFILPVRVDLGNKTYRIEEKEVEIKNVEEFFNHYKQAGDERFAYANICKNYLIDKVYHGNVQPRYMNLKRIALTEYFKANGHPVVIPVKLENIYSVDVAEDEDDTKIITLDEIYEMLTAGGVTQLEKSVVMSLFHRGLDESTMADRFNFYAWKQLVNVFGTEDYSSWDLGLCPVPLTLIRIKRNYKHRGYLDRDAIIELQKYLRVRKKQTGSEIQLGQPIYLNRNNQPITIKWLKDLIPRLAENAEIQEKITVNEKEFNAKHTHEIRTTLKSILLAYGCAQYVAELALGHNVGDQYEEMDKHEPEKSRLEYAKASHAINIFTKVSNIIKEKPESDRKIKLLEEKSQKKDTQLEIFSEAIHDLQESVEELKSQKD